MSLRECDKCGEMVDEAKAFCPGCGRTFVEEAVRTESTEFNLLDGTMQMGNTMYNQMLSDMGLNISGAPDKPAEVVPPAAQVVTPATQPVRQVIQPAAQQAIQPAVAAPAVSQGSGVNKWIIIGGIAVLLLVVLLIAVIVVGLFVRSRFP